MSVINNKKCVFAKHLYDQKELIAVIHSHSYFFRSLLCGLF